MTLMKRISFPRFSRYNRRTQNSSEKLFPRNIRIIEYKTNEIACLRSIYPRLSSGICFGTPATSRVDFYDGFSKLTNVSVLFDDGVDETSSRSANRSRARVTPRTTDFLSFSFSGMRDAPVKPDGFSWSVARSRARHAVARKKSSTYRG